MCLALSEHAIIGIEEKVPKYQLHSLTGLNLVHFPPLDVWLVKLIIVLSNIPSTYISSCIQTTAIKIRTTPSELSTNGSCLKGCIFHYVFSTDSTKYYILSRWSDRIFCKVCCIDRNFVLMFCCIDRICCDNICNFLNCNSVAGKLRWSYC